ncbi:MAG: DNA primase [Verrucomicrobia bacterium]|nr:DNA primase [Verrucomicrobiota bacterium]
MAGLVSPATIEQIRAANDIVDVIGSYLPLKRAGGAFVTLCPFHKEKTPSFHVNPQRQIFHCFGCHKGGDVFTFVREYEGLTFIEAVRRLAERANIPLESAADTGDGQARHVKESLWKIHEQIAQHWQKILAGGAGGQIARDYLARRGVSEEAVRLFRLGYAPEAWDDTVQWARGAQHPLALVEQAGLILRKEGTDRVYDRFRGRLMFPICDEQGRVVAFSGRVLRGDEKTAKYVNSPETPIFTKSRIFYGLDKSKRAILDAGFAVVCEGQLDLITAYTGGVKNVVAPQGTALTAEHARILKRYVDEVVLCFDSDTAGQEAAVRVLDSLLASGLAIRVATVPAPHDPDSFIRAHGGQAFARLVRDAEGFFDFYLNHLCAVHEVRTDKGRLAVARAMGEALRKTGSALLLDTHAQKTAQRLGVAAEAVRIEFSRAARSRSPSEPPEARGPADAGAGPPPPSEREFWLLRYLLQSEDAGWVAAELDLDWIRHPLVRQIVARRLAAQAEHRVQDVPSLLAECPDAPSQSLITEAVACAPTADDLPRRLASTLELLRNDAVDRELARLTQRLAQPGLTEQEHREIEVRKARLRERKRQPIPQEAPAASPA